MVLYASWLHTLSYTRYALILASFNAWNVLPFFILPHLSGLILLLCSHQCMTCVIVHLVWDNPSETGPSTIIYPGADPGFQVRGGAHLKKLRRAERGTKMFGVFRVKNHDFAPKNLIFSNFRGAPPPPLDPPLIPHGSTMNCDEDTDAGNAKAAKHTHFAIGICSFAAKYVILKNTS